MRKSEPRAGSRTLRVGAAAAAVSAAVLAGAVAPAYAAVAVTLTPGTAPIGGGTTVVAEGVGAFPALTATVLGARISTAASCPTTYGTSGTAATATRTDADEAEVTLPVLAAGTYKICIYGAAAGGTIGSGSALTANSGSLTVNAANTRPTLSSTAGPTAGGNQITATGEGAYLTSAGATPGVVFNTAACPATYTITGTNIAGVAAKTDASTATITVPGTLVLGSNYNVCIYAGVASNSALLGSGHATYKVLPGITLSPTAGSSGVGATITVTAASSTTFPAGTTPGVTLTTTACPSTFATDTDEYIGPFEATGLRISGSKIAATLPATDIETAAGGEPTGWNVCVYSNNTDGALILAPATYTVAAVLAVDDTVTPSGGPAQGGTEVTITGTGFPFPLTDDSILSASIGGSALTDLRTSDSETLIGTTSSHAAGTASVSVTTAAGTETSDSNTAFTYSYGITVSPNADAPWGTSATNPTLDIMGAGFNSLTFGTAAAVDTAPTTGAYVFLVNNSWFTTASGGPAKNAGLIGQCKTVIRISDNEIICTLDLQNTFDAAGTPNYEIAATAVPVGTYSIVVVNDISDTTLDANTQYSRVSSGSTFTVSDY